MSVKLVDQNNDYLDKNLVKIFHILSIYHHQSQLIGSAGIRNMLYVNDYDLNENFKTKDTDTVLQELYQDFLNIFEKAKKKDYYVMDLKTGEDSEGEALRWNYNDMKTRYKVVKNKKYTFKECLLMDATIKIDIVYLLNNIFTDITNNYFISINKRKIIPVMKVNQEIDALKADYIEYKNEKNYFKALKRLFSIEKLENNVNREILTIFNSNIGRLYKGISNLNLIIEMLEKTNVSMEIIKINIENTKMFISNVVEINVDWVLDDLYSLDNVISRKIMVRKLEKIVEDALVELNQYIVKHYKNLLKKFI